MIFGSSSTLRLSVFDPFGPGDDVSVGDEAAGC